jgi:hypothetical protein
MDIRSGPLTFLDLYTWTLVAAVVMIWRTLSRAEPSRRQAAPARLLTADLYRSWTS